MGCGSFITLVSGLPVLPWRFQKMDPNLGPRFAMDRYYTLTGATDNLGKAIGWTTYKKNMLLKAEEFNKPNPLTALLGAVASALPIGVGAALGCSQWLVCKEHAMERAIAYGT